MLFGRLLIQNLASAGGPGAPGADGADGNSVLNGAGAPGGGTGVDGDFYINTATNEIHGPKAGGVWPAGVSLIGPAGADGADGAEGPQGPAGADGAEGPQGPAGADGVAATRKWAFGTLSVDQTTNIADENPVKLDTWSGTLTTNAVNYRVTLEAGKRYLLKFIPGCQWSSASAYVDFKFRDVTNGVDLTPIMEIVPPAATYQTAGAYVLQAVNYGAAQRIIEVRIDAPNNFTRIFAIYTSLFVQEIADA